MESKFNKDSQVADNYLTLRKNLLNYSDKDMGLILENDEQVYIALFDIPIDSGIVGSSSQSLGLVFGLNTHIYHANGYSIVELEKYSNVREAMQSLLTSSHQVLFNMQLVDNYEFFFSDNIRVYLKTRKGIYFKELNTEEKIDKFLIFLMNNVFEQINKRKR